MHNYKSFIAICVCILHFNIKDFITLNNISNYYSNYLCFDKNHLSNMYYKSSNFSAKCILCAGDHPENYRKPNLLKIPISTIIKNLLISTNLFFFVYQSVNVKFNLIFNSFHQIIRSSYCLKF